MALRLEGIEKVFAGGQVAVSGVNLEVATGEMVVLLGPSGCGKSTLLRMVAGVETPTNGRIYLDERDVTDLPPQQRDVAMVFQNYALYPHMTVRDNLAFGLKVRGLERGQLEARVAEVAETLGISSLLERRPFQLSGGQRQRVALGRAIARRAKVFLLDEPLSNLDAQLRVTTRMELARLHRRVLAPMLYVTHDQEEALTLGDRIVVMAAGRIQQVDTPLAIYHRPATRFVGGFVGSPKMNFLSGDLSWGDDGPVIACLGGKLRLRLGDVPGAREIDRPAHTGGPEKGDHKIGRATYDDRRQVILGIRPEEIDLVPPGTGDLSARVDVIEPLGREALVHLVVDPSPGEEPFVLRVLTGSDRSIAPETEWGLRLRPEKVHLFDPESERRIG